MYKQSLIWTELAKEVIPGGACTLSKRPGVAGPAGCYPAYVEGGEGCRVWDVDGRRYVDWTSALGANLLGTDEIFSLPSRYEVEYARALTKALPCAERVKFASSGTEATMAAFAVSRAKTGRTIIITSDQSYHGWHDYYRALKPDRPGVPDALVPLITTFRYNDVADLDRVLELHRGQVAAVMMEPALIDPPRAGFLDGVKQRAHAHGALLIFDEMLLGGRLAIGGGSEYFGVVPDLATYGKAFGGGFPLGILCGREEVMRYSLFMSGTFCGHPGILGRALGVLEQMRDAIPRIHQIGERLIQLLRGAIVASGAPLTVVGYPCLPVIRWTVPDNDSLLHSLLQQELATRGVLIHESGRILPNAAHDADALIDTGAAFQEALNIVSQAWRGNCLRERLRGEPVLPAKVRAWEVMGAA